jgi:hypothetical protein
MCGTGGKRRRGEASAGIRKTDGKQLCTCHQITNVVTSLCASSNDHPLPGLVLLLSTLSFPAAAGRRNNTSPTGDRPCGHRQLCDIQRLVTVCDQRLRTTTQTTWVSPEAETLMACSLTCRSWLPRSQMHLFAAINCSRKSDTLFRFDRLLARSSNIGLVLATLRQTLPFR